MEFDKSRVFTALNADEVKVGSKGYFADSIRVLKETIKETLKDSCAAAYGEIDEIKNDSCACRFSIKKNSAYSFFYLVKEPMEKKYRPYHNTAEIPGGALLNIVLLNDETRFIITAADDKRVYLGPQRWVDMQSLYDNYMWPNGTPCGKEVEE